MPPKNALRLVSFIAFVLFTACDARAVSELDNRLSIKLDSSLSRQEVQRLRSDFASVMAMNLRPGQVFSAVFNGGDASALMSYLDDRINYVISDNVNPAKRLFELAPEDIVPASTDQGEKDKSVVRAITAATNIGLALWMVSVGKHQAISFQIDDMMVPVNSSRLGLIQLGPGYQSIRTSFADRVSTLVHEARHSDCTGGISLQEAEDFVDSKGTEIAGHACGHTHSICPSGHSFAGIHACDDMPWGAYSVEGIYDSAVAYQCSNCSEAIKQVSLATMYDSLSRVQVDLEDMLQGKLGAPDMSSDSSVSQ